MRGDVLTTSVERETIKNVHRKRRRYRMVAKNINTRSSQMFRTWWGGEWICDIVIVRNIMCARTNAMPPGNDVR